MSKLFDIWILFLLLLGALVIWLSTGLTFTQDEVSALSRLHFDSIGELIEGGVKTDYHPAFVQVFLYVWTALFGTSELAVKIPSMLAGFGSLLIAFRLSSKLYDRATSLILISVLAFTAYYAFYFSIARPYAFGTFFVLLQVSSLYRWKKSNELPKLQLATFVLASVLAAWTHYFSLVAAALVALWGFYWLGRKYWSTYGLLCISALLIFSPHLPLTLYHLSKEGIGGDSGWLGPPEVDVWWKYFVYLGQSTWIGVGLLLASAMLNVVRFNKMNEDQKKFLFLGSFLMLGLFSLAYFYSVYVSPVFQYSILIFASVPFLMSLLGVWVHSFTIVKRLILSLSIAASLYGLFVTQAHPVKMRYQLYDEIAMHVQKANQEGRMPRVISVMNKRFLGVYKERMNLEYEYAQSEGRSLEELKNEVVSARQGAIVQVNTPSELLYMVHDEFGGERIHQPAFELWNSEGDTKMIPLVDSTSSSDMYYSVGEEFKVTFAYQLANLKDYPRLTGVIDLKVKGESVDEGVLVIELHSGEDKLVWRGRDVKMSSVLQADGTLKLYHAIRLQDVLKEIEGRTDLLLVAYYWNKAKTAVETGPLRLRVYPDPQTL
jgi:uncharacterized membrane protein